MKKICIALSLIICLSLTVVSAASYDMASDENLFKITEISNPSKVYVDGVLVAENTTEIPKSLVTLGTHNIKIVNGETEVYNQNVDVVNSVYGESTDYDFSDYTSGAYTVNGVKVFAEGASGFASSVTVDEEHGTSFGVVYREGDKSSWARNYIPSAIPNADTDTLHYEFEVYSTTQSNDRNMYFETTKVAGGTQNINLLNFIGKDETIRIYSDNKKLEDISRDTSGVWYKFVVDITLSSLGGGIYDLKVLKDSTNGFTEVKSYKDLIFPSANNSITAFRFIGPYDTDTKDSYLAIDNINISYKYKTPVISSVNGESFDAITFGTKNISFKLSSPLDAEMFVKENVSVGDIEIESATVNGDIVDIVLGEKLQSDTDYVISFSPDTLCSFGGKLGYPLTCKIHTIKNIIEVRNVNFSGGALTADIENTSGMPKTVNVVISYFKNDILQKTTAVEVDPEIGLDTSLALPEGCTDISVTFMENYLLPMIYKITNFEI